MAKTDRGLRRVKTICADLNTGSGGREDGPAGTRRGRSVEIVPREEVGCSELVGDPVPAEFSAASGLRSRYAAVVRCAQGCPELCHSGCNGSTNSEYGWTLRRCRSRRCRRRESKRPTQKESKFHSRFAAKEYVPHKAAPSLSSHLSKHPQ